VSPIPVRLGIQQRVLASYRVPFFDALARECSKGLGIFAGEPRPAESIDSGTLPQAAQFFQGKNHHLFNGSFYLCWQSGLVEWLESWQPEVLVVEANLRYLRTPAMVRWMHARRRPVIGWGLGAGKQTGMLSGLRRRFLSQFDALITYSQQGAAEYARSGFPAERILVAPNAVAPRPSAPLPERPVDFNNASAVILFVGRLQARKRVDLLIKACAALPGSLHPRLWIVGDGPEKEPLEALAGQVYPQAEFFGARFGDDLAPLFLKADLFVLPGTGGLAIQQAMAFGLPVIAAEADGTQADLVRPQNGWCVPPGDLDALVRTMQTALQDAARLRQMGRVSYQIVSEEINLERMLQVFEQAVRTVLED
jgi:glycosyltransferase involved in cell wall biosynthesis